MLCQAPRDKEAIVENLADSRKTLYNAPRGAAVLRSCGVDMYLRSPAEWRQAAASAAAARDQFAQLFGGAQHRGGDDGGPADKGRRAAAHDGPAEGDGSGKQKKHANGIAGDNAAPEPKKKRKKATAEAPAATAPLGGQQTEAMLELLGTSVLSARFCAILQSGRKHCQKHLLVCTGFGQAGGSHLMEPDGRKKKKRKSSNTKEANASQITAAQPAVEAEPDRKKSKKRTASSANAAEASDMSPAAQPEAKRKAKRTKTPATNVSAELNGQPVEVTKPKERKKAGLMGAKVARTAACSAEALAVADTGRMAKRKKRTQTDGDKV